MRKFGLRPARAAPSDVDALRDGADSVPTGPAGSASPSFRSSAAAQWRAADLCHACTGSGCAASCDGAAAGWFPPARVVRAAV